MYLIFYLIKKDLLINFFQPLSIVETLKPADVHKMLAKQDNPINLILEQINLGRGRHWFVIFTE